MGDNKKKWLWISLGIVAGILVLGYIGTALYFMSHFLPNTKVNGKDFSYAKEEDVADYLKSEVKKYELNMRDFLIALQEKRSLLNIKKMER